MQLCQSITLDEVGIKDDRRWMLIDEYSREFLSQRQYPKMALIHSRIEGKELIVKAPGMDQLEISTKENYGRLIASLRKSKGFVYDCGEEANDWFSEFLDEDCRLVRLTGKWQSGKHFQQRVESKYDPIGEMQAGFTDGFPLTILSTGSFYDLKRRLPCPISLKIDIENFRTNIIIDAPPYVENIWKIIRVGGIYLHVVKPCDRCDITTIDHKEGKKISKEPLETLGKYQKIQINGKKKIVFAQNCVHDTYGEIDIGDEVVVIEENGDPFGLASTQPVSYN